MSNIVIFNQLHQNIYICILQEPTQCMFKQITSTQNPEIKNLMVLLEKSRERKKQGLLVAEGVKEIALAVAGGYVIEKLFFVKEFEYQLDKLFKNSKEIIEISKDIYQKVAYRESTEGVIALIQTKKHTLSDLQFTRPNPLVLVAESPEKPGNIGAILRTADAAGVDAVIITHPTTDLYNPNVIRSSVGSVFTTQIALAENDETIEFLTKNKIQILSTLLSDHSESYLNQDFTKATAIVMGTEATGLTEIWQTQSYKNIIIPMYGKIDSMNVSVATAIVVFEAVRQRN